LTEATSKQGEGKNLQASEGKGAVSPGSIATISYLSESTHAGSPDIDAGGSLYACWRVKKLG